MGIVKRWQLLLLLVTIYELFLLLMVKLLECGYSREVQQALLSGIRVPLEEELQRR